MNVTLPEVYSRMGVLGKAQLVHFALQPAGFSVLTSTALQHARSCLRRRCNMSDTGSSRVHSTHYFSSPSLLGSAPVTPGRGNVVVAKVMRRTVRTNELRAGVIHPQWTQLSRARFLPSPSLHAFEIADTWNGHLRRPRTSRHRRR